MLTLDDPARGEQRTIPGGDSGGLSAISETEKPSIISLACTVITRPARHLSSQLRPVNYSQAYVQRWLILGEAIGAAVGLVAAICSNAIDLATRFLRDLSGSDPTSPVGESVAVLTPLTRPWLLPIITGLCGAAADDGAARRQAPACRQSGLSSGVDTSPSVHRYPAPRPSLVLTPP